MPLASSAGLALPWVSSLRTSAIWGHDDEWVQGAMSMLSSCCCSACFAPKHDIGLLLPQIHQHLLGCGGEGNGFMAGRDKQKPVPLVPGAWEEAQGPEGFLLTRGNALLWKPGPHPAPSIGESNFPLDAVMLMTFTLTLDFHMAVIYKQAADGLPFPHGLGW